jgi:hypothetical protein
MEARPMQETTRDVLEALFLTLLYFTELDFLVPENSRLGRTMNKTLYPPSDHT